MSEFDRVRRPITQLVGAVSADGRGSARAVRVCSVNERMCQKDVSTVAIDRGLARAVGPVGLASGSQHRLIIPIKPSGLGK